MKKEVAESMTVQELCDYAVKKIVKQGGRCTNKDDNGCLYGSEDGKHCAIGWLLDHRNDYLMKFEADIESLVDKDSREAELVPNNIKENIEIFFSLQSFHDSRKSTHRFTDMCDLQKLGIDTSGRHWQKWVDMGI